MTSIFAHTFNPTDYSASTMVKVMKDVWPMDDNARDHYHCRMIEAMEKRKLIDDEIESIKRVIIEDDEKRASMFLGHDSHLPTLDSESCPHKWESLHATGADAVTSAPQICNISNKRVRIGTVVKVTTGRYAGHTGMVVSRWNKNRPQNTKLTTWNVLLFSNNKVIRRVQKTLVMDITNGF
jgi:KOW motif